MERPTPQPGTFQGTPSCQVGNANGATLILSSPERLPHEARMHLSKLVVRGFRSSADGELNVTLPGRLRGADRRQLSGEDDVR